MKILYSVHIDAFSIYFDKKKQEYYVISVFQAPGDWGRGVEGWGFQGVSVNTEDVTNVNQLICHIYYEK